MADFQWRLPAAISPGRDTIRAEFCDTPWARMPREVETPEFEIR
jgi:hypothetical protein